MSSIQFSPVIIGTMRLGQWGEQFSTDQLEGFIEECLALGLKDFDHADIYGHYTTEAEFGAVLKRRPDLRDQLQITTKCGIKLVCEQRPSHRLKSYDSTKAHIITSAERSLQDLHLDTIDLLLLHRPDYLLHPQEVAEAFEQLRSAGKVKHFGVSNYSPSQFDMLHSFTPLVTNQVEISLLHLQSFQDGTLDQCLKHRTVPTAWSPLGGGSLFRPSDDARVQRVRKVATALAEQHEVGLDQILLAWLAKHPAGIIPVLGTSKVKRIQSALEAVRLVLSHEEWYELWEASVGVEVP
ncbi:MAG: aldo/keto reductase [Bacteroidota bacterium]